MPLRNATMFHFLINVEFFKWIFDLFANLYPDEVFLFSKTSVLYFQKSKHKEVQMPLLIKHVIFTQKVKSGLLLLWLFFC